jgi:hypothetical protein
MVFVVSGKSLFTAWSHALPGEADPGGRRNGSEILLSHRVNFPRMGYGGQLDFSDPDMSWCEIAHLPIGDPGKGGRIGQLRFQNCSGPSGWAQLFQSQRKNGRSSPRIGSRVLGFETRNSSNLPDLILQESSLPRHRRIELLLDHTRVAAFLVVPVRQPKRESRNPLPPVPDPSVPFRAFPWAIPLSLPGPLPPWRLPGRDVASDSQRSFSPRFSIATKSAIRRVRVSGFLAVVMRKKKP